MTRIVRSADCANACGLLNYSLTQTYELLYFELDQRIGLINLFLTVNLIIVVSIMLIRSVFQNSIIKSDLFYNQIKCFSQSLDSCAWKKRHINDEYVKKARYENYRARSAFKLLELDTKHDLIRPGQVVIDLGASPGSWTQAATRLMGLSQDFTKVQRVK